MLLQCMVPQSGDLLSELMGSFVVGKCGDVPSMCQCGVVEGIQLTRFLASQYGYGNVYQCFSAQLSRLAFDPGVTL